VRTGPVDPIAQFKENPGLREKALAAKAEYYDRIAAAKRSSGHSAPGVAMPTAHLCPRSGGNGDARQPGEEPAGS
jgi:hypothetical protein